ncbi:zinc-dependent alcohol dehydrogenase [Halohasta salina]|uniref:zinc-dependent alcohol dehydrogenase n=1 Tax=Halohasta salina TaxID=2961621 RepID=UPI0020A357F3|nr:zinc-binding alcohol dehydrogenase [Halohasta salina]
MARRSLYFVAPGEIEVREEPIPEPAADELLVRTTVSAVSPGTECLVYEGNVPSEMAADANLDALSGSLSYPLNYGYAAVGVVEAVGSEVDPAWLDRRVFAFHPHESHFCATADELHPVPEGIDTEQATLLPTVETAVTLVQDGAPKLGERVVVFGQGPIGLVTTALLGAFPLDRLVTVDYSPARRERSRELGATTSVDPDDLGEALSLPGETGAEEPAGADLTYELSGNPEALDAAVSATGYDGRIVVGSWYGTKPTELDLGGRFHRSRISLSSSQVSTIDPALRGRWDRERRLALAWDRLADLDLDGLLTDRYPITEAPAAYDALSTSTDGTLGTLFSYETGQ